LERVDEIVKELRLNKCQNTKIGGPLVKGVSGGEHKRTSIGVELITDPQLIFLDEPTTGLDSFTATSVIETLRELANSGRTVISTIHQPNSDIYEIFDRLMLLAQGKIIYFNEARLAVDYFGSLGDKYRCPELSNPADHFMSIMSIESHEIAEDLEDKNMMTQAQIQEEYTKRIEYFNESYQKSALKNDIKAIHPEVKPIASSDVQQNEVSWWYQLGLLLRRNFLNTVRLPQTSYVKLIVTIITAIFTIILFQNCDGTIQGVQNRNGALFFMTMTIAFNSIQNIILIFPDERPVFLREVNNNMYSVSAYFFGKVIAELPASILTPVIYGCIVYFSIGLSTVYAYKFPVYLGLLILIYSASGSYALIISTLFADKQLAVTLTPILIIPFMLFAGFFVNQDNIPIWLIEFQYLSFFKYGYQVLMLNEYTDLKLECMDPPKGKYIPKCDPLGDFNSPQTLTESALALVGMYVGCYIFALISMKLLSRKYQ